MADDIIRKPAIKITQGRHTLFATSFTVADFMLGDALYRVEHLDPEDSEGDSGFQRVLDESRARALAKDLHSAANAETEGGKEKGLEVIMPTSVLLATSGAIAYDDTTKEISFSIDSAKGVCPLLVVDGQHRIAGLRQFAELYPDGKNFPIFASIITEMNKAQQSLQFLIVNAKQREVDKALQQRIIRNFSKKHKVASLPFLPTWVEKSVEKRTVEKSVDIALFLNKRQDSPWCGKIAPANAPKKRHGEKSEYVIQEKSFTKSVQKHILALNNPLARMTVEMRQNILLNYWVVVADLFVEGNADTVVYKTNGINFFHAISAAVITRCADLGNYKAETIKQVFEKTRDSAGGSMGFMNPYWWQSGTGSGKGASKMNQAGVTEIAAEFQQMLNSAYAIKVKDDQY